jgi:drug/metabolite transporter (DMT)-like permease
VLLKINAYVYGLLGVLAFSITLPASKLALAQLDPMFVGLGRASFAAICAAIVLMVYRSPMPSKRQLLRLMLVAAGIVFGFPLFSTLAMQSAAASHGAIVVGLLPLATALFGALLAKERLNAAFWIATIIGSATIAIFTLAPQSARFELSDLYLLAAVISAGFGYAEGARLSKELGAWQTICWALLVSTPFLAWPTYHYMPSHLDQIHPQTFAAFAYVSFISMFLGFFAWYKGLAMGGIAKIGQLQLLQPFFTLIAAYFVLAEHISKGQILAAFIVISCVFIARRYGVVQTTRVEKTAN